jgi:D-alanyl-D-alanine-carboxypeptidase/D-alanyl-D-alanine-endopeptidase
MHLPPTGDPSHIIEKTGGGAGFSSYIAMIPARHIALFFAFAEGGGWKTNVFTEANNMMLNLAGLPPLPEEPARPLHRHRSRPRLRHRPPAAQEPPSQAS